MKYPLLNDPAYHPDLLCKDVFLFPFVSELQVMNARFMLIIGHHVRFVFVIGWRLQQDKVAARLSAVRTRLFAIFLCCNSDACKGQCLLY